MRNAIGPFRLPGAIFTSKKRGIIQGRRRGSAAHIGQGMLTGLGLVLALSVGLLPGALLVGAWIFLQLVVADLPLVAWQLPLFGLTAVVPLVVIVGMLTRFGGVLWDQLDPSVELLNSESPS